MDQQSIEICMALYDFVLLKFTDGKNKEDYKLLYDCQKKNKTTKITGL